MIDQADQLADFNPAARVLRRRLPAHGGGVRAKPACVGAPSSVKSLGKAAGGEPPWFKRVNGLSRRQTLCCAQPARALDSRHGKIAQKVRV